MIHYSKPLPRFLYFFTEILHKYVEQIQIHADQLEFQKQIKENQETQRLEGEGVTEAEDETDPEDIIQEMMPEPFIDEILLILEVIGLLLLNTEEYYDDIKLLNDLQGVITLQLPMEVVELTLWLIQQMILHKQSQTSTNGMICLIKLLKNNKLSFILKERICYAIAELMYTSDKEYSLSHSAASPLLVPHSPLARNPSRNHQLNNEIQSPSFIKEKFREAGGLDVLINLLKVEENSELCYSIIYSIGESIIHCESNKKYISDTVGFLEMKNIILQSSSKLLLDFTLFKILLEMVTMHKSIRNALSSIISPVTHSSTVSSIIMNLLSPQPICMNILRNPRIVKGTLSNNFSSSILEITTIDQLLERSASSNSITSSNPPNPQNNAPSASGANHRGYSQSTSFTEDENSFEEDLEQNDEEYDDENCELDEGSSSSVQYALHQPPNSIQSPLHSHSSTIPSQNPSSSHSSISLRATQSNIPDFFDNSSTSKDKDIQNALLIDQNQSNKSIQNTSSSWYHNLRLKQSNNYTTTPSSTAVPSTPVPAPAHSTIQQIPTSNNNSTTSSPNNSTTETTDMEYSENISSSQQDNQNILESGNIEPTASKTHYLPPISYLYTQLVGIQFRNEDSFQMLIELLPRSTMDIQKQVVKLIILIIKCNLINRKLLSTSDKFDLILNIATKQLGKSRNEYLQLLTLLGDYTITKENSSLLFDLIKSCPSLDNQFQLQLLHVIEKLTQRKDPVNYFHFHGNSPGCVSLNIIDRFPSSKTGYSFCCWLKIHSFEENEFTLLTWKDLSGNIIFQLYFKKYDPPPLASASTPNPPGGSVNQSNLSSNIVNNNLNNQIPLSSANILKSTSSNNLINSFHTTSSSNNLTSISTPLNNALHATSSSNNLLNLNSSINLQNSTSGTTGLLNSQNINSVQKNSKTYYCLAVTSQNLPMASENFIFDSYLFSQVNKWYHIGLTHEKQSVTLFINGKLIQCCSSFNYPRTVSKDRALSGVIGYHDHKIVKSPQANSPSTSSFCGQIGTVHFMEGSVDNSVFQQIYLSGSASDISPTFFNQSTYQNTDKKIKEFLLIDPINYNNDHQLHSTTIDESMEFEEDMENIIYDNDEIVLRNDMSLHISNSSKGIPIISPNSNYNSFSDYPLCASPSGSELLIGGNNRYSPDKFGDSLVNERGNSSPSNSSPNNSIIMTINKAIKGELKGEITIHKTESIKSYTNEINAFEHCFEWMRLGSSQQVAALRIISQFLYKHEKNRKLFKQIKGKYFFFI